MIGKRYAPGKCTEVGVEPLGTILSVVQQLLHGYVLMVPDPESHTAKEEEEGEQMELF